MKESVEEKISNILNKIKPFLNNDGGDVEFIKFENGKATFLLKHNEEIEIKDLPYDIKYKINERMIFRKCITVHVSSPHAARAPKQASRRLPHRRSSRDWCGSGCRRSQQALQ